MKARSRQIFAAALSLALGGCGRETAEPRSLPASAPGTERERVLGAFLENHWQLPLAPQGAAPEGFVPVEASLDPSSCGGCHPEQYDQWRGSLHAGAFSPGFSGQLIEGSLSEPSEVRHCQSCHTPLGEQQPFDASLDAEPDFDAALRQQGLVCAACHVRAHRRFGPPRRPGLPALAARPPHSGFEERPEFQESRFCAPCHQFFDDAGVNGKPVENTWREWRDSPQAAAGETCQSCHMPDRRHTWKGIHDPETVRAAVDVELRPAALSGPELEAVLVLTSHGVGHAFPSYVTPRVVLAVWQQDEHGGELEGTRLEATIGRKIDFGADPAQEVFDTRVAPGESVKLDYALPRAAGASALAGRVTVDPDYHYRGVFESLLEDLTDPEARARIADALERASNSSYPLTDLRLPLPGS